MSDCCVRVYTVRVKTGDRKNAGTDANVKIRLHDVNGRHTPDLVLDVGWHDDFKRGAVDKYVLNDSSNLDSEIGKIELWRDDAAGYLESPEWYVEHVEVEPQATNKLFSFPLHRWIAADRHYIIQHYDAILPQDDPHKDQRVFELAEKKKLYEYDRKSDDPNCPIQVKKIPDDEQFSDSYQYDISFSKKTAFVETRLIKLLSVLSPWESVKDIIDLFGATGWNIERPNTVPHWDKDTWFGAQRLSGCNPKLIELCTEIPEKLAVTPEMAAPFLEGLSLDQALKAKRIYKVDLKILEGLEPKGDYVIPVPIALFFVTNDKSLLPIAIQLFQQKGPGNPVFLPSDDPYVWLIAKVWYNLADATYHQSLSHLGFTHLQMASVSVCTNRNLSPSHPIFKLLAPHFLYLIAINTLGLTKLISPDGHVAKTMSIGHTGMFDFICKGSAEWGIDTHCNLPKNLYMRGVDDAEALPNYHYRDDGLVIWDILNKYVTRIVYLYYGDDEKLQNDPELGKWGHELTAPYPEGIQMKGVPGEGKFTCREQLIEFITSVIFNCSAEHAAVNFSQYDEYAFPPNYSAQLEGKPPANKDVKTEADLMAMLPNKQITLDTTLVVKLLGTRGTNNLGSFEQKYLFHPEATKALKQMEEDLQQASITIKKNNQTRAYPYNVLDPKTIPNSISI
ncbi:allene oxide synthase-lipoxygenase protein-like [Lineus longissimus]|uniref:allene oxide synthase-lipoxygenase protein-like n=1 Tax=Lineus longissimus TaxID=88925 RepID=UPI002B4EF98C